MRVGNFSLLIPEGQEYDNGHVRIRHGQQYTLRLGNNCHVRVDAEVEVDGKPVGNFRVNAGDFLTLERPSHDAGRFTAYLRDSAQGQQVNLPSVSHDDLGLIKVVFRPEKRSTRTSAGPILTSHFAAERSCGFVGEQEEKTSRGLAPVGTGLSGHSDQSFTKVPNLDYDPTEEVVISLRLVCADLQPRELVGASKGNPTPPPV